MALTNNEVKHCFYTFIRLLDLKELYHYTIILFLLNLLTALIFFRELKYFGQNKITFTWRQKPNYFNIVQLDPTVPEKKG